MRRCRRCRRDRACAAASASTRSIAPTIEAAALLLAEMLEHHRAGPDHADRVGDSLPGDVGRRAMHRLEHRREIPSGLMLPEGAMPMVPVQAGPRSDRMSPNRLEPTTTSNQSGCSTKFAVRISMWYLSHFTFGIFLRHRFHAFVPIRHGDGNAVGFSGRGQMLLRPRLRQLEREFQDAVDADAGHHRLLGDEFAVGVREHSPADG